MEELIVKFASILWGPPTMVLIFGVGILFSIKTRFFKLEN